MQEERNRSSDDADSEEDEDFEPSERGGTARDVWISGTKNNRNKSRKQSPRRRKSPASRQANGKGGRWGGGRAGSDPSVLLMDPYAVGTKRPWAGGMEKKARATHGTEEDVEVVLCQTGGAGVGNEEAERRGGTAEGGTLVVCPLSLIGQWRGELESKTRKGALTVSFFYGTTKSRCDGSMLALLWEMLSLARFPVYARVRCLCEFCLKF